MSLVPFTFWQEPGWFLFFAHSNSTNSSVVCLHLGSKASLVEYLAGDVDCYLTIKVCPTHRSDHSLSLNRKNRELQRVESYVVCVCTQTEVEEDRLQQWSAQVQDRYRMCVGNSLSIIEIVEDKLELDLRAACCLYATYTAHQLRIDSSISSSLHAGVL